MRLQKFLAEAGVASRRSSELIIKDGRVAVNGIVVTEMGVKIDPLRDVITVDGKYQKFQPKVYILFYKPPHVMCTSSDPEGRETVLDYFKDINIRLYTVGRLDYDSEGLIIVTNDGELANRLTHPSHEIKKTYYCICRGAVDEETLEKLRSGVELDGKKTAPARIKTLKAGENDTTLLIEIGEGRNRQIRRMFEEAGFEVVFLRRDKIGSLTTEGLKAGQWRYLTDEELKQLCAADTNKR